MVSDFFGSEGSVVTFLLRLLDSATFVPVSWAGSGFPVLLAECQIFVGCDAEKGDEFHSYCDFCLPEIVGVFRYSAQCFLLQVTRILS